MTIPAPLPPPTAEAVDAAVALSVVNSFFNQFNQQIEVNGPPVTLRVTVVAWTQHDGTLGTMFGIDPTANPPDTVTCRGLIAEYGAVVVRVYEWLASLPAIAQVTADAATQAAANDASAWAAPE